MENLSDTANVVEKERLPRVDNLGGESAHLTSMHHTAQEPDLSVIIVNWNSVNFLRRCLASIYTNTNRTTFEIIVVDNASGDGCGEILANEYPSVRFVQSNKNLGFAGANNLGAQMSSGRALVFLNPDTELVSAAIDELFAFVRDIPDAGVVGARLLNSNQSIQTSCIQRFPTVLNRSFDADLLRRLFPTFRVWGTRPLVDAPAGTAEVEMISGACQMIRREVLEQVGGYDCDYFMYAEDADLCLKAHRAGFKNYYLGRAVIIHHGGQSSNQANSSHFSSVVMRESLYRYFRKDRGLVYAFLYRLAMALSALGRLTLLSGATIVTLGLLRRDSLLCAIKRWGSVLRWAMSSGKEQTARHDRNSQLPVSSGSASQDT